MGVQTEWQRIKKSLRSRPEPKKAGLIWQTTQSTKFKHAPQEMWNLIGLILYDVISGTGPFTCPWFEGMKVMKTTK